MSLTRGDYRAADQKIFDQLKLISEDLIKRNPKSAIWKLEAVIRNLNPEQHRITNEIMMAIESKRREIQVRSPYARIFLLRGMLLEKIASNSAALNAYRLVRNDFPHYWHAFLYPAQLLQNLHRFEASKNLLLKMQAQAKKAPIDKCPHAKQSRQAEELLANAEQHLEERRRIAEEKACLAVVAEQKRKAVAEQKLKAEAEQKLREENEMKKLRAEEVKKQRAEEAKKQRAEAEQKRQQQEKERQHPCYNQFSVFADRSGTPSANEPAKNSKGIPANYAQMTKTYGAFPYRKVAVREAAHAEKQASMRQNKL